MRWLSSLSRRDEISDLRLGWTPRQTAQFMPSPFKARFGLYSPWNEVNGPKRGSADEIWKLDMQAGYLYRMAGKSNYVTRLGLSYESVCNNDKTIIKGFHDYASHLLKASANEALPKAISEQMLNRMRADDSFSMPVLRLADIGCAVSFYHTRRDPREPGYRAYYFDVFSPNLAAKIKPDTQYKQVDFI